MQDKLKLLNICETARGGVGIYQNFLQGLGALGFDVRLVAPAQHADILDDDVEVRTFDHPRRGPGGLWRMIRTFRDERRSFDPDICFFHSTFSLLALLAMRLGGDRATAVYCPHGWAITNYDPTSVKGRVVRLIEGSLCGLADVVVNVSHHERDLARSFGYRGRQVVVENAVPEPAPDARNDLFADAPEDIHLLFVGRFDRQKGLDLLLPAFARARRTNPKLRLHVIGAAVRDGGPLPDAPEGAEFLGWIEAAEIDSYYRSADALVVPSRWEGLCLVIPEALRNGTPVYCADRSGMADLIEEGRTGGAFAHDEAALADCLALLEKPRLAAMRKAARAAYEARFALDRLLDELATVLRRAKAET